MMTRNGQFSHACNEIIKSGWKKASEKAKNSVFERACDELNKEGEERKPILALCSVKPTKTRHKLYLHYEEGITGRINALWLDGQNAGKLIRLHSHARVKWTKMMWEDFQSHLQDAIAAEKKGDISAKNRALRAAIVSLFSDFEGEVHHLYDNKYQLSQKKVSQKKVGSIFEKKLQGICRCAIPITGSKILLPRLRLRAIRNVLIHPIADIKDPLDNTKRITAIDAIDLYVYEVKSTAMKIREIIYKLYQLWNVRKKMSEGVRKMRSEIIIGQFIKQSARNGKKVLSSDQKRLTDKKEKDRAQIELLKALQDDYTAHLKVAREGDQDRRERFIRAAVIAQAAVFDGYISILHEKHCAPLADKETKGEQDKLKKRQKIDQLCELANKKNKGSMIIIPRFKVSKFRDIYVHSRSYLRDQNNHQFRSPAHIAYIRPTPKDVEEEEERINKFLQSLKSLLPSKVIR